MQAIAAEFAHSTVIPFHVAALRLALAVLLGGVVGLEREWRNKPAGMRTHILVSLAACLVVLAGHELAAKPWAGSDVRIQPFSLIEAVTAGVAFLAAGLIFTAGDKVKNVTTGASLWLAGAIGLTIGAGEARLAAMATGFTLFVLIVLRVLRPQNSKTEL